MATRPLVSVIIPMYNAEKFIEKCIEHLVHQTYKNITRKNFTWKNKKLAVMPTFYCCLHKYLLADTTGKCLGNHV